MVIDPATEEGARADARLRDERIAWLVTVGLGGTPIPTPVWFWWNGETIVVYSQREKAKLRHIAANPQVSVALRTDEFGDEITVITGRAVVDPTAPSLDRVPAYIEKYADRIAGFGTDPASAAAEYSVAIKITPTKLRQWRAA